MKGPLRVYGLLIRLYPRPFRDAFAAQMLQTFADLYQDVAAAEGRAGVRFWLPLVADEVQNVVKQHAISLTERTVSLNVPVARAVVAALIFLPLYPVLCGLTVKLALSVPHPSIGGVAAIAAMGLVALILPGIVSVAASCFLAGALLRPRSRRGGRSARLP